ncbi:MAG: phosphoribosylglycinamide formyltransferase [Bdellovibrionales bacterium]|nr:phosphoribosylglycinamide formyltransferase [Bdellovibrionales bacterium]
MKKIAIFASGSGSNAEAIINWAQTKRLVEVVCVFSDRRESYVLERASIKGVPAFFLKKKKLETAQSFDQRILKNLSLYNPDWIILAGYMKLLTPHFLEHFKNRVVNIHPSLLPLFPGKDGYGDAYKARVSESGCTVHYVDEGIDTGEVIEQKKIELIPGESFEAFKQRGQKVENEFYPQVLERLFENI